MEEGRSNAAGIEYFENFIGSKAKLLAKDDALCQRLHQFGLHQVDDEFHPGGIAYLADMDDVKTEIGECFAATPEQGRIPAGKNGHQTVGSMLLGSPHRRFQEHHPAFYGFVGKFQGRFQGVVPISTNIVPGSSPSRTPSLPKTNVSKPWLSEE